MPKRVGWNLAAPHRNEPTVARPIPRRARFPRMEEALERLVRLQARSSEPNPNLAAAIVQLRCKVNADRLRAVLAAQQDAAELLDAHRAREEENAAAFRRIMDGLRAQEEHGAELLRRFRAEHDALLDLL